MQGETIDRFPRPPNSFLNKGTMNPLISYENVVRLGDENLGSKQHSRNQSNERKNMQSFRNANRFYNPRRASRQKVDNQANGFLVQELTSTKPPPITLLSNKKSYKEIDKQIIKLQKAIEKELRDKLKQQTAGSNQEVITEAAGEVPEEKKQQSYDFLTNPQIQGHQEVPEQEDDQRSELQDQVSEQKTQPPIQTDLPTQMQSAYSKFNKLYRHYERELDKLYIKRENPGIFSKLKPKNPKLYITGKTNQVQKTGEPLDHIEHRMRIFNRENTPCVPELIIPSFPTRKDQMAQSILAYLKEYSPLVRGDKVNEFPKCIKNILQDELSALHQEQNLKDMRQMDYAKMQLGINQHDEQTV